jgi:hypothetical protein
VVKSSKQEASLLNQTNVVPPIVRKISYTILIL